MSKVEDMLRKVQALLARADHPNTPVPEAEAARAKAEELMYSYRIDEAMLAEGTTRSALATDPKWGGWLVCDTSSEFATQYRSIASSILHHVGIRGVFKTVAYDDDFGHHMGWHLEAVGYEADLQIAELLYTACQVAFQVKLEPKYDPSLSDQVNAYVMRSAGMEGWRIAQAIYGKDDRSLRPKVRAMFKKEAEARGEDPTVLLGKGNSVKNFRLDFANGFSDEIYYRLSRMRAARGEGDRGLVLANRAERINEAFYDRYPQYRPASGKMGPYRAPNDGCPKCAKAKSGYCRDHGYLRPTQVRQRNVNYAARDRGEAAARAADIGAMPPERKVENQRKRELG